MALYRGIWCCIGVCVVMYRCGYIDIYSAIIIGMFRYIIIIIYEVPTDSSELIKTFMYNIRLQAP